MAFFDFTGAAQSVGSSGTITGGTTHPNITFTFSIGANSQAQFSGGNFNFSELSDTGWVATLTLTMTPATTINSIAFTNNPSLNVSGLSVSTNTVPFAGGQQVKFSFSGQGGNFFITSFDAACFLTGTRIATPRGEVAVEDLVAGDRVLTAQGGETTVQWLGHQDMDTRFQHPAKINPICITAGALAPGLPQRDLYLSADHAVALDGLLINAGALVNSTSIYRVAQMPKDGFTYYHVETDAHELILAEGCAAESYLDIPDRSAFQNGAARGDAAPIPEMALPRITTARLLPDRTRARIANRAGQLAAPLALAG